MVPVAQKHRRPDADETVKLSRTILNKVLAERTGILSADATSDSRFEASASISSLTIRSMMCVPLLGLDGEPMGVINLDTQNVLSRFTKDDLDLLLAVAGQAALSYESARLLTSHMEKLKQDSEMAIARNVQQALLAQDAAAGCRLRVFRLVRFGPGGRRRLLRRDAAWTTARSACRSATWRGRGFRPRW